MNQRADVPRIEVSRRPNRRQLWTLEILRVCVGEWDTRGPFLVGSRSRRTVRGFPKAKKAFGLMLG